jgi:hypothetical protein
MIPASHARLEIFRGMVVWLIRELVIRYTQGPMVVKLVKLVTRNFLFSRHRRDKVAGLC